MEFSSRVDVLIVAAHMPELEGVRPILGSELRSNVAGLMVVGRPVGVGMCASALGTAAALAEQLPRAVVLVGTCGAYAGRGFGIQDLGAARRIDLVSAAVAEKRGMWPGVMQRCARSDAGLSGALCRDGVRMADVATTLAISSDDGLALGIASEYDCDLEHLEAFAVATACQMRNVPFAAILSVANEVGARGHEQWLEHHVGAGARAAAHVGAWLRAGAPGLAG